MNIISLEETGSALIGFGLAWMKDSVKLGLLLVGVGVAIKIAKAILNKGGFPVQGY